MVRLTKESYDLFRDPQESIKENIFNKDSRTYSLIREKLTTLLCYMDLHPNPWIPEEVHEACFDEIKRAIIKIAEGEIIEKVNLSCSLKKIWREALRETFEDGMESMLSRKLVDMLATHKNQLIQEINNIELLETIHPEIVAETLQTISRHVDSSTYEEAFRLMVSSLSLSSPVAREGAILALERLNDKRFT